MEFKGYLDPEELLPGELRPPAPFIEAASRDLPGVLLDMGTSPREDNVERLVRSLVKLGHNRTVCQWALYDHIKAGRIEVEIHLLHLSGLTGITPFAEQQLRFGIAHLPFT